MEYFNLNFNVSFKITLEQYICAFSWINKERDNIKMHGKTVKSDIYFYIVKRRFYIVCLNNYMFRSLFRLS